jgi:tyrosyl-tRNA synthetase
MAKESVKNRLASEVGISYTEFSYMLLQANDFRHLHTAHGVELQMGGSDQWGNITAGIDLIRKASGSAAHGLTWPLLLKSDGTKFGKTADGAVWLDPDKTSPYQFRQFWLQADDEAIVDYLLRFSTAPLDDVRNVIAQHQEAPHQRTGQRVLAREMTALVHGEVAAAAADEAAEVLFGGDPTAASAAALAAVAREVPSSQSTSAALGDVVDVLVSIGLASSKGDARRTLDGSGFKCNGATLVGDVDLAEVPRLQGRYLLFQRGKKTHHLVDLA